MEPHVLLFVVLVAFSAFFSGTETAFFSLSAGRVRAMVKRDLLNARLVERLKKDPQRLLITILVGNNIVNITAAAVATKIAIDLFGSTGVGIASGAVTLVVLVFGEIVPKSFGQMRAGTIARLSAPVMTFLEFVLAPVVALFALLMRLIFRAFPGAVPKSAVVSEEEIRSMMQLGVEEGSVEKHEREFIERLFRFNDMPISAVMVPREKVVMLDGDVPIVNISHFASHSGFSRFPVYEGGEDIIKGLVHIKDIARAGNSDERTLPLVRIASPIRRVKLGARLDDVFRDMQKTREHMYFVEDETGAFAGVVTMEDIVEELLGEIHDESDAQKNRIDE